MTGMFKRDCAWKKMFKCCARQNPQDDRPTPLSRRCKAGKVKVCKVTGDRKLCARIAALGLYPGSEAELINPENGRQCIVRIHGGQVCLDRTISDNILVTTG